ncbi:carbonic anhydrase [Chitinophaga costaii]|uniref:Carbonic anhydrase n=1 Tax=Chitinophaga costaii TaxID=1335309 RepID=A0A1C4AG24_9BACT|nr:carbonic anhydrase family protein [Chitinophaga costaii]PUZ26590.1 carbonic anhydrase [Chitinophaga costaii]SCB93505.1 carbonic anhydrase [Chitinophaga costaii]
MHTQTAITQKHTTSLQVLESLKAGNARFVENRQLARNFYQQMTETAGGQWPVAAIVSCMDSRTAAELIFDQGLGDIFSIRLAGAVITDNVLGSLEYACKVAGAKLIVIMGHSHCGAVKGACDAVELGNLTALLNKITPIVHQERSIHENRNSSNHKFVEAVTHQHTERSVQAVMEQSNILRSMILQGEIGIVGAHYNVENGQVTFLENACYLNNTSDSATTAA